MHEFIERPYQGDDDFWRIRNFLRHVFVLNDRREFSWPVIRWDYWCWHGIRNLNDGVLERDVFIWETGAGDIAAVLNRENAGYAFLQVHPTYKSKALEEQVIRRAEESLIVPSRRGGKALRVWCDSMDIQRQEILKTRGYELVPEEGEWQWRYELDQPIPERPVRDGYLIRALGEASELPSRSWASWRAFHSDEPDEKYGNDWTWYLNIQSAPLYRRDLDLVAISSTGEVAAFTTIWYDDVTRCGFFEPVGTMPEHQRRGLASALLCEGMRRMKKMGATQAMVGGEASHANALYRSVFGPIHDISQPWEKRWVE
jgi:mycothiol synthase